VDNFKIARAGGYSCTFQFNLSILMTLIRQLFQRSREISERVWRRVGQLSQALATWSNCTLWSRQVSLHRLDQSLRSFRISTRRCKTHFSDLETVAFISISFWWVQLAPSEK